ncbi:MAG: TIGR00266 family protein [Syntrophomonadaceae bacterium]|nr:TIGR00266 family protein [Syntrophomonadaceae bacterium]
MKYQVLGTTMQCLSVDLEPGEKIYTESGAMAWMSSNIKMDTNFKGGLLKSFARAITGESLTFTFYEATGSTGNIGFVTAAPGKILPIMVQPGTEYICQKGSFLCAQPSVELSIHFNRKLGAGFFGGEGFILQKLTGQGMAFVEIDGEVLEKQLAPGETILVDTGHVAMFEATVSMDIQMVKGVKNVIFGGEGLFLTTLRGPGRVWVQTLTLAGLAGRLRPLLGSSKSSSDGGMLNSVSDLFND